MAGTENAETPCHKKYRITRAINGVFMPALIGEPKEQRQRKKTIGEDSALSVEERPAALAHVYLEMRLPLGGAFQAAQADLIAQRILSAF